MWVPSNVSLRRLVVTCLARGFAQNPTPKELYRRVLGTNTVERVKGFARSITASGDKNREDEYLSLETQIRDQHAFFDLLCGARGLGSLETPSAFDLQTILGHLALHGGELILHSAWSARHPESRAKMLKSLQALVKISASARERGRPRLGLTNLVHIMNAARLTARELGRSETRDNINLSVTYCHSIELFLDFMDATLVFFPAWADSFLALKDTLTAAAASLAR
ncbi:hypothetical protein DL93DRAFT_1796991 [Clavulina sp. PMI_390]|nr:hypothetical protein DL93DRAFT_1796991 [Clavulina sp. PMI_390]